MKFFTTLKNFFNPLTWFDCMPSKPTEKRTIVEILTKEDYNFIQTIKNCGERRELKKYDNGGF